MAEEQKYTEDEARGIAEIAVRIWEIIWKLGKDLKRFSFEATALGKKVTITVELQDAPEDRGPLPDA